MTSPGQPEPTHDSRSTSYNLPADSYTAQRLQHATPKHLHATSRRYFIGPIPEGWLKSHRSDWYKHHLGINYSSRTASFSTDNKYDKHRRLSGLDGPSTAAVFGHSFPQPEELQENGPSDMDGGATDRVISTETPPALLVPRATSPEQAEPEQDSDQQTVDESLRPPIVRMGTSSSQRTRKLSVGKSRSARTRSGDSYVTASEGTASIHSDRRVDHGQHDGASEELINEEVIPRSPEISASSPSDTNLPKTSTNGSAPGDAASTAGLIQGGESSIAHDVRQTKSKASPKAILKRMQSGNQMPSSDEDGKKRRPLRRSRSSLKALVQFDLPEDSRRAEMQMKAQMTLHRASTKLRRSRAKPGQIVKMERMLVRVDTTTHELTDEFDENEIQKVEARTREKWREYMVTCRQSVSDDAEFVLQMYQTRVIAAIEDPQKTKRAKHEIDLSRKTCKVNLFSSLDKSVVVWVPSKRGTTMYIMQARSSSNAVEWYTFLRNILGWARASELQVNVPDMTVSLMLQDPFKVLETSPDLAKAAEGDDEALRRTMHAEQAVARAILQRCMEMLAKNPEWEEIIRAWTHERIGLCWKRYDRLEWIHGANERKMFGTIAMLKSHELEIRPKQHYPTSVTDHEKGKAMEEPPPVEGFLVRLTSQKGDSRRLGKMFFKRLYFATFDQYLFFTLPAKASPPPPPKLPAAHESRVPSARQITDTIPIIYAVNPYPVEQNEIAWLAEGRSGTTEQRRLHDRDAQDEAHRKTSVLHNAQGFLNLCNVKLVRNFYLGTAPVDESIEEGSDADFDASVPDTTRYDGTTNSVDSVRTFEMVMNNGLVVRMQAYDEDTKKEWIKRLRALIRYWKRRSAADIMLMKSVRQQNLDELNIDEEAESYVGQYARKWEVTQSFASPELYNLCGISCCRTVHLSGNLYRKPRRHSTFARCSVVLCDGRLLIFQDTLRKKTGREVRNIHQERIASLDLQDCYLYSGLLTESDLLYQNQTFDSNKPGHHALPRIYLEDGWTSTDEDIMTCFVVWHGKKKSWFRSQELTDTESGGGRRSKLTLVSRLGVPGRSIVFRARSRAERDHWVLAIQTEIERLRQRHEEDFRIEEKAS